MSNATQPEDRPATLKRQPKPAADEKKDPVDPTPAVDAAERSQAPTPKRAPKHREPTYPLSSRVVVEVLNTLDEVVTNGRAPSQRAAIEEAILGYWGKK